MSIVFPSKGRGGTIRSNKSLKNIEKATQRKEFERKEFEKGKIAKATQRKEFERKELEKLAELPTIVIEEVEESPKIVIEDVEPLKKEAMAVDAKPTQPTKKRCGDVTVGRAKPQSMQSGTFKRMQIRKPKRLNREIEFERMARRGTPTQQKVKLSFEKPDPMAWQDLFEEETTIFRPAKKRARTDVDAVYTAQIDEVDQKQGFADDGMQLSCTLFMDAVFIDSEGMFREDQLELFLLAENLEGCLKVDERSGLKTLLDLSRTWLDEKRLNRLRWALEKGLPVTSLDISYCPDLAKKNNHIVEAAMQGGHVTVISLEGCELTDRHAKALAPVLEAHPELQGLDLSNNRITFEGGNALVEAMELRATGGWLRLQHNDVGEKVLNRLEEFYLSVKKLTMLSMRDIVLSLR